MKEHSIWSEEIKNNEFLSLKDNIKTELIIKMEELNYG